MITIMQCIKLRRPVTLHERVMHQNHDLIFFSFFQYGTDMDELLENVHEIHLDLIDYDSNSLQLL